MPRIRFLIPLSCAVFTALAQNQPAPQIPAQFGTRPPSGNDTNLRPLSPEEIPPNLNFYAVDPLYKPGVPLGWAAERIEEKLDRGMLTLSAGEGKVYLGWRLLKADAEGIAFNVYRSTSGNAPVKLNDQPITRTTDFVDASVSLDKTNSWFVRPVLNGLEEEPSVRASLPANAPTQQYKAIKLKEDIRSVAIAGIGDLDGDGTYDFVVKHPGAGKDPGRIVNNAGTYKFDAYNGKTGEFMWRIDLGWNVDTGIWWTPMVVRDLDGDNKAEVCLRAAPYAATREESINKGVGFVLDGPEWLVVYDGVTGKEIDKVDWIERGKVQDWADNTGNRASRHMLGIAYLDGKTPSVLVVRGTYGLMKVDAWTLKDKKLVKVWRWTNERAPFMYQGQGQHSIKVGDIDGDGCDEILNGSLAIDNDGRTMWCTGLGHGDRFYLTDIDPDRPGLEVLYIIEEPHPKNALSVWDAKTGELIFGAREPNLDNAIDQCLVADIDPNYPGMEVWANKGLKQLFFSAKGEPIPGPVPPTSGAVWWDADLLRELLSGGRVYKWKGDTLVSGIAGSVQHVADILGDWREEIVTFTNGELRIYSTVIPAADRRACLMQDPIYRHDVTHRSMGYAHVPMTSYYLGTTAK